VPVPAILRRRCQSLLATGENIRYLIPADGMLFGNFLIAITQRRIAVIAMQPLHPDQPENVFASFPRITRLGPIDTSQHRPAIRLGEWLFEIAFEYLPVVAAVDAESADHLPEDPFPEL